jgi:ketosteroid isomerase-like protein
MPSVHFFWRKNMAQVTSTEIRSAIMAANEKFMTTFIRGDAAGIAALYTEGGQLLPPNSDFIAGKQAIQAFWEGAMNMGIKAARLETIEVEGHGNTANEVGKFTLQGAAGQVLDTGKYVVIWKREAGQWKLYRDIWNSSKPAPAH